MNDRQLAAALRAIDRPVAPDADFADALFETLLPRAVPATRPPVPRTALLVAALLAAVALGVALAVGSNLFQDRSLVEASPSVSVPTFVVEVPDGVTPASRPEAIAAAVLALREGQFGLTGPVDRIVSLTWLAGGTEYPTSDGGSLLLETPFWVADVEIASSAASLFLADATATVVSTDFPAGPAGPEPTLPILPTLDPKVGIQLVRDDGTTIQPRLISLPGAEDRPSPGPFVAMNGLLWMLASPVYSEGPARLIRIDPASNEVTSADLPDEVGFGSLVAGTDRLWLSSGTSLLGLDGTTGGVLDRFELRDASVVGETAEGVWLRTVGGGILLDPATGNEIRSLATPEGEGQAYRGFWQPPAFGSIWDVDRNTGLLHRIHPVSGETTETIDLGVDVASGCGTDFGLISDVPGRGDLVGGLCATGMVLIDPASNVIVGTLAGRGVPIGDAWWTLRTPEPSEPGWDAPGGLIRTERQVPAGEATVLSLSLDRYSGLVMAVAGDALWLLVAERAGQGQSHEHNAALLRIPLAQLPT